MSKNAVQWTPEQTQAIEERGTNMLVSAAAGSGKTALLTERLKRLVLEDGADCSRLLVLTFTRAAAGEMKQRFKKKLTQALEESGWKLSQKQILAQIRALTDAQITTIHAFSSAMIRRYFETAEVDPSFRIADEAELAIMTGEAVDEVLEERFAQTEEQPQSPFRKLADIYTSSRSVEGLKTQILKLLSFFEGLPYPKQWVEEQLLSLGTNGSDDVFKKPVYQPLLKEVERVLDEAYTAYTEIDELSRHTAWSATSACKQVLADEYAAIQKAALAQEPEEMLTALADIKFGKTSFVVGKKDSPETADNKLRIRELRGTQKSGAVNQSITDLKKKYLTDVRPELEAALIADMTVHFKELTTLAFEVDEKLSQKKEEANVLSYHDLERLMLKLLKDEKTRASISAQYEHIFLDEYQDTNEVQEEIIRLIEHGDNRFMVGDLKQSIYRFRNADPNIFIDKYNSCKDAHNDNALVLLNKNFRSSPEVINGINTVFSKMMSTELGELDYDDEARLRAVREDHTPKPEIVLLTNAQEEDDADTPADLTNTSAAGSVSYQAKYTAKRIRALYGTPGADGKPITYNDIGILYATLNPRVAEITRVLTEEGIPVVFEGDKETFDAEEVHIMLALLSLIDNHKQDLPLLTVLHHSVFGFTLDEEAKIRALSPEALYFYEAVEAYKNTQNDLLAQKLAAFYDRLLQWRSLSHHLETDTYLWQLCLDSGIYAYYGGLPGGAERQRNLRILTERAKSYSESALKGMSSFLQFIAKLKKRGSGLKGGGSITESTDAVHLMSIHKSKGLEYPVVFVCDLGRRFNTPKKDLILYDKEAGVGIQHLACHNRVVVKNDTLLLSAVSEVQKRQKMSEDMRLLYVAMSRARDRLILMGTVKDLDKSKELWKAGTEPAVLLTRSCLLDWVMAALLEDQPENLLPEGNGSAETKDWMIRIEDTTEAAAKPDLALQLPTEQEAALSAQLMEKLSQPLISVSEQAPLIMSVSQIKKRTQEQEPEKLVCYDKPEEEESEFTGAEKGTIFHEFMQYISFDGFTQAADKAEEARRQIALLTEAGKFTQEQAQVLDAQKAAAFFNSELGKRLLAADKAEVLRETAFILDLPAGALHALAELPDRRIQVQGILDCCFLENGKWILLDYKTDRKYNDAVWEQNRADYSVQTALYAMALEKLTGIPVAEQHIYYLNEGQDYSVAQQQVSSDSE